MLKYANGAFLIVACAALGVLFSSRIRKFPPYLPINLISPAAFYLFCGLALAYALYPNFIDHAEPAMATLGIILLKGRPLYPGLDEYSFHGLLYGPLLFEIQAGAIFLGSTLAGLPVILSSKLAGLLAFLAASGIFFKLARGWKFGRTYYTLLLLPFGILAFWNRCEPLFLLLVACSFWAIESGSRPRALLVLGLCAGLASGLKLHGFLYVAPAIVIFWSRGKFTLGAVLILIGAAAGSFLLLFFPGQVSLFSFIDYLVFATRHGLSWHVFLLNLIFVCALWSPLIVAFAANGRWQELRRPSLLALGALQVVVAIVGSKPGAGIHHLLPFIPVNALIFARYLDADEEPAMQWVWIAMLLPGLAACAVLASGLARDWRPYAQARQELERIQAQYPDVVMGLAGGNTYSRAFLRPLLEMNGATQVEYSTYMDLQLAGVADTPLRQAFESCLIKHLAMPKGEPAFSLRTYYPPAPPLFSDGLRETFGRRFVKVENGRWYDTYGCMGNPP